MQILVKLWKKRKFFKIFVRIVTYWTLTENFRIILLKFFDTFTHLSILGLFKHSL